jgi:osmoprotectant transport system ATP-binding protein
LNAIEFVDVKKSYGSGDVVRGVSMAVSEGSLVALMGASGSGKTTMLKMVNRLVPPTEGKILFFGEDTAHMDVTALRKKIGYVLQAAALFPHMTVAGNISTSPGILGWDSKRTGARVKELLSLMGLDPDEFAGRYPSQLSGGQQQRVGLARAMAGEPRVLLMDEPFGALDAITRSRLQDDLLRIHGRGETTILFVTHDIDEAFRLGNKVAVMNDGVLRQYGTPREIVKNPADGYVERILNFLSVEAIKRSEKKSG